MTENSASEPKKNYALITGASSGIGQAFAKVLASKKKPLILIGRDEQKLKALSEELRSREGIDVRFLPIDLARSKELPLLPGKLQNMGITIDVLVNNAGFGKFGREEEVRYEDALNMVNLNCRALLALTKLFLPEMVRRHKGAIINVASTAGFAPWPDMATYAATKAFVISYSESLAEELKSTGVKIVCTCPGPVATAFQERAGMKVDLNEYKNYADPQTIVEETLGALKSNKTLVITGRSTGKTKWALRFLPRSLVSKII
ncbi:MAG: SDR family oxidoreductase [Patescibacteria group bacterium]|nr:SDR family oxidoreductase [Patescibacteria group bacterium]